MQSYAAHNKAMPPLYSMPPIRAQSLFWLLAFAVGVGITPRIQAADQEGCTSTQLRHASRSITQPIPSTVLEPVYIYSDRILSPAPSFGMFSGNVRLTRGTQHLTADELTYDRDENQVDAHGQVKLMEADNSFETETLRLNLATRIGATDPVTYKLADNLGRGQARALNFEGPDRTRFTDVSYTTCPNGQDDWFLKADSLHLDTAEDIGTAYHTTFEFLGVPFFYLPYLSFPISDQRKTGFLIPNVGYSNKLGTTVATPYYINLAPNYDATITPRIYTHRGIQLQNQFRYLGSSFEGQAEIEYLPNDHVTSEHRAAAHYLHRQTFNPWWSAAIDVRGVSDKNYLKDFGDSLNVTSRAYLPQSAAVNYHGSLWNFTARANDYQILDRTVASLDHPYARVPQLLLAAHPTPQDKLRYRFESEWVNFEHDTKISGQRLSLNPGMSLSYRRSYGFLTPEVALHYVRYDLSGVVEEAPSLTLPILSLDSGLIFERDAQIGTADFTQTIEPRAYYLYVPHKRQDHLPLFDTDLPDFSFTNLFRNNRFIGGDRVGDANQMSLGVTTRLIDTDDGVERLSASIGRIFHFDEREVNIPAATQTNDASDITAEALAWIGGHWHARGALQWDRDRNAAKRSNMYFQYQPAQNRILNFGYRFIRNELEQGDISGEWPLTARVTFRARSLYSLEDHRNVDAYVGLDFNSCCWIMRLHAFNRLTQTASTASAITEKNRGIMLEIELSGFGKLGSAPDSPLRQGLFGFAKPP